MSEKADFDAVAAFSLGFIQPFVRGLEHLGECHIIFEHRTADADRQMGAECGAGDVREIDRGANAFGDSACGLAVGVAQEDSELLAADAANRIAAADNHAQFVSDEFYGLIARVMAERVVDLFEMVGVDNEQGGAPAKFLLGADKGLDLAVEGHLVQAVSQTVATRLGFQPEIAEGEGANSLEQVVIDGRADKDRQDQGGDHGLGNRNFGTADKNE